MSRWHSSDSHFACWHCFSKGPATVAQTLFSHSTGWSGDTQSKVTVQGLWNVRRVSRRRTHAQPSGLSKNCHCEWTQESVKDKEKTLTSPS